MYHEKEDKFSPYEDLNCGPLQLKASVLSISYTDPLNWRNEQQRNPPYTSLQNWFFFQRNFRPSQGLSTKTRSAGISFLEPPRGIL